MLLLAMFYKRDELAMRTTILYVGNYFASGVGSLLAAGILQMRGISGLAGWQVLSCLFWRVLGGLRGSYADDYPQNSGFSSSKES